MRQYRLLLLAPPVPSGVGGTPSTLPVSAGSIPLAILGSEFIELPRIQKKKKPPSPQM
jgi:hypothetical protein